MKKTLNWFDENLEIAICVILMSAMTVVLFVQVIMRYVFNSSLEWSEELGRYMFIWLIYLGISYGCKLMKHVKIDAALSLFPKMIRPYVVILGDILFALFALYIVFTGAELVMLQAQLGKFSPALHLPMTVVNAAPPVGFLLVVFRQVQTVIYRIKCIRQGVES